MAYQHHFRKIVQIVFVVFIIILLFSGCFSATANKDYVLKINNERVYKGEFMLYLNEVEKEFERTGGADIWDTDFEGQTAEEVAKERAFNSIRVVKITTQKAGSLNVSLSQQEKEKANKDAESFYQSLTEEEINQMEITPQDVVLVMEDKYLYNKVMEEITKDYEPSQADFEKYLEENYNSYKDQLVLYSLRSILVKEEQTAKEVREKALAGEDFKNLVQEYEIEEKMKTMEGMMEAYQGRLENEFGMPFDLEKGEISDIMPAQEGYYIFKVEDIIEPTKEQVTDYAKSSYMDIMKSQLFSSEYSKWEASAQLERNEQVWKEIHVIKS